MRGDYVRLFSGTHREIQKLEEHITHIRNQVYTELDEHREAINADTVELNVQNSRLDDVEKKLDMIAMRLEKLSQALAVSEESHAYTPLTVQEQQVFLALYTIEHELCLRDLALRAGVPLQVIPALLESMAFKSIPLQQNIIDGECRIALEKGFKTLHAKNNVVLISDIAKFNTQMRQHVTLDRFTAL